ncbi:hypothetical protein GLI01_22040 [Gluconacetobacter liquefaciens]|uniref:Uncharacterized protein n=2 Tax=Gluconacetobacter liquefaciens TaxID=89584 RepID=A0A370G1V5_GLULI|nr:hypothetical protein C7453_105252 [Gluconacetobacter liquefaciens]GEB38169.1 hypothetical protein GLI01_22040 [Gluconacetobacter liquefaciens]
MVGMAVDMAAIMTTAPAGVVAGAAAGAPDIGSAPMSAVAGVVDHMVVAVLADAGAEGAGMVAPVAVDPAAPAAADMVAVDPVVPAVADMVVVPGAAMGAVAVVAAAPAVVGGITDAA